jgi:NADPH:quinone reductase-like Zn-dependent oxidoreductase
MAPSEAGQSLGHEAIGIVEDIGAEVRTLKRGDLVVVPFAISDGACEFCHQGLQTECVHVAFFGNNGMNGAQAEALRIPYADGTLFNRRLPRPGSTIELAGRTSTTVPVRARPCSHPDGRRARGSSQGSSSPTSTMPKCGRSRART